MRRFIFRGLAVFHDGPVPGCAGPSMSAGFCRWTLYSRAYSSASGSLNTAEGESPVHSVAEATNSGVSNAASDSATLSFSGCFDMRRASGCVEESLFPISKAPLSCDDRAYCARDSPRYAGAPGVFS
jgi:hypothetical protein